MTYSGFLATRIRSFGRNSTNLKGPVPIGCARMSRGETWQGYTGDQPEASSARNEGCGRFRRKVTSYSPLVVTSSRLLYQVLRGLRRSFSVDLPVSKSQVHLTSLAVNSFPSYHLRPWRNGRVSSVPSSFHDQPVARSGTIDAMLFCATACRYMTRLLKTPIIGRLTAPVASSCIDIEAGLSKCDMIRTPPDFCASAVGAASASNNANAATNPPRFRLIAETSPQADARSRIELIWRSSCGGCRRQQVIPRLIRRPCRGRALPMAYFRVQGSATLWRGCASSIPSASP